MRIGVFVSYNHKDINIAKTLVASLTSLSENLDVFIDRSGLEGGDDYEATISRSIAGSQWFLIICSGRSEQSGKDMSWCFYEAGQFRAKLQAADQINIVRDRICYVYDVDRPSQLSRYQGYRVTESDRDNKKLSYRTDDDDAIQYENTDLFEFFRTVLTKSGPVPLRNLDDPVVRKLMRGAVRKLTLAFAENTGNPIVSEVVFQPRISFTVAPTEGGVLGADTPVLGEYNALQSIFGIASENTTWGALRVGAAAGNRGNLTPLWVVDVERAIADVVRDRLPIQTEFLCLGNDGRFYRPIIARYKLFKNENKKFYIVFIPSRDRRFNLNYRTSLLISALIMSIRFRQRVLPTIADLARDNIPESRKAELLQKMLSDIVLVESESSEFGLEPPKDEHDEPALLDSFREGSNKDFMRQEIERWSKAKIAIFECVSAAQSPEKPTSWTEAANLVLRELPDIRTINGKFINFLGKEILFTERVDQSHCG